jgi:hypothetical protein
MTHRSEAVPIPHPETFEWIYSNCSEDHSPGLVRFLEGDQHLFWITGKPASGKSTLMKMIGDDPRTMRHLDIWASGEDIVITRFYFWCSGIELQMSQEGLVRTLLYETLQALPELAPMIFPDRMEDFVLLGSASGLERSWTMENLLSAYKDIMIEITKSKRMFLLIDGLDEFNGDHPEQVKLVDFLHTVLRLSSKIKICVSSRPWNIFADAFHTHQSLRLEDLT